MLVPGTLSVLCDAAFRTLPHPEIYPPPAPSPIHLIDTTKALDFSLAHCSTLHQGLQDRTFCELDLLPRAQLAQSLHPHLKRLSDLRLRARRPPLGLVRHLLAFRA